MTPTMVIGIGNWSRGDDAIGLAVARSLIDSGIAAIRVECLHGSEVDLLELWRDQDRVILVDAICSSSPPGTVHQWDLSTALPLPVFRPGTSHAFDLSGVIELAKELDRLPHSLKLYGIEGARFDPGRELSPEIKQAIPLVVETIKKEVIASDKSAQNVTL